MDEKYIENLGMSQHVDEGLWDRLKSRAAGYAQATKNVASKGTTETGSAKFNSLFSAFLKRCIRTIEDFDNVIIPYAKDNKITPEQADKIRKIDEVEQVIRKMVNLPVTEANFFTRPFSALGAQASGNVESIIQAYQKLLSNHFNSFVQDAKKLNVVPEDYIGRKIAATYPAAAEFLKKFKEATGIEMPRGVNIPTRPGATPPPSIAPTSSSPTSSPTAADPVVSSPVSSPEPATVTSEPEKPTTSTKSVDTTDPEQKSSQVTPDSGTQNSVGASSEPIETPVSAMSPEQKANLLYTLIEQAVKKINDNLRSTDPSSDKEERVATSPMLNDISKYTNRDEWKAIVPFPPSPKIGVNYPDLKVEWKLRYLPNKDTGGHTIQLSQESKDLKTGKTESTQWEPFVNFKASDVINRDNLGPNVSFDIFRNIATTYPKLAKVIEWKQKNPNPNTDKLKKDAVESLRNITHVTKTGSAERGLRKLDAEPEAEGGTSIEKATENPPVGGPESKEPIEKPSPERRSRTVQSKTSKEKPPVINKPKKTEPEKKPEPIKLSTLTPKKSTKPKTVTKQNATADKTGTVAPAPTPIEKKPEEKPVVAPVVSTTPSKPISPSSPPKNQITPPTQEEKLKRFNDTYLVPNKLEPFTKPEQMNAFWNAVGIVTGEPGPERIQGAHQVVMGKPKTKTNEGFKFQDFFSL